MQTSLNGRLMLVKHEGIALQPYLDIGGVWTYGIGHAETSGLEPNPRHMPRQPPADDAAALVQVFDLFAERLKPYERAVARVVTVPLQHLVSKDRLMEITTAYRNPAYTKAGAIDCELEHPVFGWIPFTASPTDPEAHGRAIYAHIESQGGIAPYVPPQPPPEQPE